MINKHFREQVQDKVVTRPYVAITRPIDKVLDSIPIAVENVIDSALRPSRVTSSAVTGDFVTIQIHTELKIRIRYGL